jgi:hypothetical protein
MYENYNEAQITRYMAMAEAYQKMYDDAKRESVRSRASQMLQTLANLGFTAGMERPSIAPVAEISAKKARKLAGKIEEGSASGRERAEHSKYIKDHSRGANNLLD